VYEVEDGIGYRYTKHKHGDKQQELKSREINRFTMTQTEGS